ncbi:MAG: lysophospholipid acyltransferase family protein [Tissierellaceae bacterium]
MKLYNSAKAFVNIIFKLIYRIEIYGEENIIYDGRLILCANHSHNIDPFMLSVVFPRQIHWMAKKQAFKYRPLAYLLNKLGAFPVDREETDLSTIKNSLKLLKQEKVLGIFPEGTRVKSMNLENAKPGIGLIYVKSNSPILPIFIEGNYKPFSKIKIYFGEIMNFSNDDNRRLTKEDYFYLSREILQNIYSIKDKGDVG